MTRVMTTVLMTTRAMMTVLMMTRVMMTVVMTTRAMMTVMTTTRAMMTRVIMTVGDNDDEGDDDDGDDDEGDDDDAGDNDGGDDDDDAQELEREEAAGASLRRELEVVQQEVATLKQLIVGKDALLLRKCQALEQAKVSVQGLLALGNAHWTWGERGGRGGTDTERERDCDTSILTASGNVRSNGVKSKSS